VEALLEIRNLRIAFGKGEERTEPVRDVSFAVPRGGRVAIVGESGCGKSLTSLAITRLPPVDSSETDGLISFNGAKRSFSGGASSPGLASLRGRGVSYVFQDPSGSLNPVMRIGAQIEEALPPDFPRMDKKRRTVELLARTGLPDPERAAASYPCNLSGGQCQRCSLAMALAAEPDLLIADEPTTALDVTTQRIVLNLIDELARENGTAVLLITHNLGLVAGRMDAVNVMYAGTIVESGPVETVLSAPRHPYTKGLLAAVPALDAPRGALLRDIPGTVPPPDAWPDGCAFHPRCPRAKPECAASAPPLTDCGGARCACFHPFTGGSGDAS